MIIKTSIIVSFPGGFMGWKWVGVPHECQVSQSRLWVPQADACSTLGAGVQCATFKKRGYLQHSNDPDAHVA